MNQKAVVVTGASAGAGRATVREFARRGARLGLLARGQQGLEAAKREVESLGGRALAVPTDASEPDQVEAAAEAVERELGPIDIWVNDAMVSVFSPIKEMAAADFKRVTDVTYLGFVYGTITALKRMLPRDRGMIVQVGSALAYRGIPLQSAYCGAKHAIQGFTESVRCELIHDHSHVQIKMVQMPALNTISLSTNCNWAARRVRPCRWSGRTPST
ncbi:MAG TPA: SDR family oxidoreductase [Pirellulales bacterium]|jgi:NAD(P)-dependent dehydrogenase (short-subunit alcohol dehydrogenase family)|nr:SDR family oxidoreductase [Pirellulales bacterium]